MLDNHSRHKMMLDKLFIEISHGRIDNDFVENFVCDVRARLKSGIPLTDNQILKLEEIFEKY